MANTTGYISLGLISIFVISLFAGGLYYAHNETVDIPSTSSYLGGKKTRRKTYNRKKSRKL